MPSTTRRKLHTIIKEDTESTKKRVLGKRYEIDNLLPQIVEKVNELRETLSEYSVKITEPSISETDNIVWAVKWIDKKIMFTVETLPSDAVSEFGYPAGCDNKNPTRDQ